MKTLLSCLAALAICLSATAQQTADSTYRRVPRTIVAAGGSVVINAAFTEVMKHTIKEVRPDRSANNSFPSRHTSWAYTASTVLSNELYRYSPWWSMGAHAVASAVGTQRILAKRHWASDVISGAATGIISTELAYFISRKIYRMPSPWSSSPACEFRPTLSLASEAVYWLNSPAGYDLCTGFGTSLNMRIPLSERWGIAASIGQISTPLKSNGVYAAPLTAMTARVGAAAHFTLPCEKLALACNAEIGASRWVGAKDYRDYKYGFAAQAAAALEWHLTTKYGFRGQASYNLATAGKALHAITLSVSSVVVF